MKRILRSALLCLCLVLPLCQSARAAASPSGILSIALSQLDYEEGPKSYSKYGQWYGIPNGHWCDMFVSWCAGQAGIPKAVLPWSAGCTAHIRQFAQMGRYQISAARGGSYVPQPGDLAFFYNYVEHPDASVALHTGVVLCVENGHVFTVEGNTVTNRLDYSHLEQVFPLIDPELQPKDYVVVKHYPLDAPLIHGYAIPAYDSREPLRHDGWVDLGRYESLRGVFDALAADGVMPGTSSYTFSPRYGMTRGDFLAMILTLYGLSGWDEATEPFEDVPEGSRYYDAVMTARSAGIAAGNGRNQFDPEIYVSGASAQAIISRTLAYVGQEDRQFSFTPGDYSYLLTPYTTRADIAAAVYSLRADLSVPAAEEEPAQPELEAPAA